MRLCYFMGMTDTIAQTLERLAGSLGKLPAETQADVLAEFENRVESLAQSRMTDDQRDVVMRRLAEPRVYVSDADVTALLRRFNPAK